MTSRERLLTALEGGIPDRLPVTTHHVMPYFLDKYMDGITNDEFFDILGMDAIRWTIAVKPDPSRKEYFDPQGGDPGFLQTRKIFSDNWRIDTEELPDTEYNSRRETIVTPKGTLSAVIQGNSYTEWVAEHLIKEKSDIEIIGEYQTWPICDIEDITKNAEEIGERGIVRGFVIPFDIYGQPGCWQDFCCIRGTEKAIMDTYDDPEWVHEFLTLIRDRKLHYIKSMRGAPYDITELGGGDASTTVISPDIFNEFVAPYDADLIKAAHDVGIRIAYHTCGGMMPILEDIAAMDPDAMETFTPKEMGADVDLLEAKKRIGDKVCMIGGYDQAHYLKDCSPEVTRKKVRDCFESAGTGGGYILAPSDHFFDADVELVKAFASEARSCTYT
jgi:hypothetical protein